MIDVYAAPLFAGARYFVVENAGHWPHFEQYQIVAEQVDNFLAEVLASQQRGETTWTSSADRSMTQPRSSVTAWQGSAAGGPTAHSCRARPQGCGRRSWARRAEGT